MKEQQVKKRFLPQDVAVLTAIFAAGAACFLVFPQSIEYPLLEVTEEQVRILDSFATDKKKNAKN